LLPMAKVRKSRETLVNEIT